MKRLYLDEYHPKSGLVTAQHDQCMPPFPVIDMHAHLGPLLLGENYAEKYDTENLCALLRDMGIERMFSLELLWGEGLARMERKLEASKGMLISVGSVDISRALDADFENLVWRTLRDYKSRGMVALKLWKNMTLMGEQFFGKNLRLDDPHYEPIWQACGEVGIPIIIHVADPPCFFEPIDDQNEHYACLSRHPEWSLYRPGMFSFAEHMQMQENVIRDHPNTTFIVAHVGSYAENLQKVAQWMDAYPNMLVDVAARVDQLGRQPYSARAFINRFQDRVLFGTDFEGHFDEARTRSFYHTHYRFFQTWDEYFEHPFPDFLGQWRVCGLGLDQDVLRKLYHDNAVRVFKL